MNDEAALVPSRPARRNTRATAAGATAQDSAESPARGAWRRGPPRRERLPITVRYALFVAAALIISSCSALRQAPDDVGGATRPSAVRPAVPAPRRSDRRPPLVRPGEALARELPVPKPSATLLVSESFQNGVTAPNAWFYTQGACLTAGATPPPGSLPACGSNAPQDPPGAGALQLTTPTSYTTTIVGWNAPLPTEHGLEVIFTSFSFEGTGGDGTLLFFTDGSKDPPSAPGYSGGCLAYLGNINYLCPGPPLANAYLGVGFDEFGDYSAFLHANGNQTIPDTVALGGAESTSFPYLGGVDNAQGEPVSLPFPLDDPTASTRQADAPTIAVSLRHNGQVTVAIDIHNGHGFVTYVSKRIVGVNGQPKVPKTVYVGFAGSNGGTYERRQIDDVTISTDTRI
jgi:hypothetical protein